MRFFIKLGQGSLGIPYQIINPFYDQSGNANTFHLADQLEKDFYSSEGWELLYRKFGTAEQCVATPFFMLYNRYTGTIRAFVNIINGHDYNGAALELSFARTSNNLPAANQTAMLNQLGKFTFAPTSLQRGASSQTPNSTLGASGLQQHQWLTADFFALYDPCTCGLESYVYFNTNLISNWRVNLNLNGTLQTIVDVGSNGINAPSSPNTSGGFIGGLQNTVDNGSGILNDVGGFFSSANQGHKDGAKIVADATTFATNLGPIIGKDKAKNFAKILGKLLYEAPRVNMLLNVVSSLVTIVKKQGSKFDENENTGVKSSDATVTSRITETTLSATISGSMDNEVNYVNEALRLPGAQTPPGQGAILHTLPIYDEVLGIWNLFEQPNFSLSRINPTANIPSMKFTPIRMLKLKDMPKVVLNPASRLQIVNIEYKILFENQDYNYDNPFLTGPMNPGVLSYFDSLTNIDNLPPNANSFATFYESPWGTIKREDYTSSLGLELEILGEGDSWNNAVISTPFMGQECISNTPVFSYSTIKKPSLRVKVILEPIDSNNDIDQLIMVHTFPGIVSEETLQERYEVDGTFHLNVDEVGYEPITITMPFDLSSYNLGYSSNSILQNEIIFDDQYVIGDVNVFDNVTFTPGVHYIKSTNDIYIHRSLTNIPANTKVIFQAANQIIVSPEATIDPEVVLEIVPSNKMTCSNVPEEYPTISAIAKNCNSEIYKNLTRPSKMMEINDPEVNSEVTNLSSSLDLIVFPNPTSDFTTIYLEGLAENDDYSFEIFDLMGKKIQTPVNKIDGKYEVDVFSLARGMYLVQVVTNSGQKLVKQLKVN